MRAIVQRRYGGSETLACMQVETPAPGEGEVLIRVRAASVNPMDSHLMSGRPIVTRLGRGLRRPRLDRPGADVAGVIEAVGANVTRFHPGDAVFGTCRGALADHVCAAEGKLAMKPPGVSFEEAAALPVAGLTALQGLRDKGGLRPGQKVLVNGASGGIGTFAVQIARTLGAEVTGVCSTANVDLVRSIGAHRVIDYRREDFVRSGEFYDLVLDLVGDRSMAALRPVLAPGAIVLAGGILGAGGTPSGGWMLGWMVRTLAGKLLSLGGSRRLRLFVAKVLPDDLAALAGMAAAGRVKPVIGGLYPLEQAAEAVREVATGHARGKIVVQVGD
jgi:NADPH:quinone reductase-like Zn-dependent oxidoreductase